MAPDDEALDTKARRAAQAEATRAALTLRHARNFSMKDVEIRWDQPHAATWRSGLTAEDVDDLRLDGVPVRLAAEHRLGRPSHEYHVL